VLRELLDDAAFGGFDEADEHGDIFAGISFGAQAFEGLGRVELGGEQDAEGTLNFLDALGSEAAALESDGVGSEGAIFASGAGL